MVECAARGTSTPCALGTPTRRCGLCGAVAYCSRAHQLSHWSDHKEECGRLEQQMKRADELNDFPFTFSTQATLMANVKQGSRCSFFMSIGLHEAELWKSECNCGSSVASSDNSWMNPKWNLPSSLCPCSGPICPLQNSLINWKDYYQWRGLPFCSPVALLLHWPLTIYHCVQLSSVQSLISEGHKLHLHYIGPDKELMQLAIFGELRALFPAIQVHMEFVGPAIPEFRDGKAIKVRRFLQCSEDDCLCNSLSTKCDSEELDQEASTLTVKLNKGFYHDRYRDIAKDSCPHLIIALNAGVAAYSSWIPTIELIKELGVPAIFSDFCEEAAHLAAGCITSVTGRPLRLPVQINPFRQPIVVDDSPFYVPCYSNCFLFGM